VNNIVLQAFELKKHFGDVRAVDGINLAVRQGEVFGFLGPNGSGKTTTIGLLLGLLNATAGRVEIFGRPISPVCTKPLRRVGSLVGAPALVPYLSGRENLCLLARLNAEVGGKRVNEVLAQVGIVDAADRQVKEYSTGMKQHRRARSGSHRHPGTSKRSIESAAAYS
jgi:ABC-type multidrug transport system ATPase subunit